MARPAAVFRPVDTAPAPADDWLPAVVNGQLLPACVSASEAARIARVGKARMLAALDGGKVASRWRGNRRLVSVRSLAKWLAGEK